jgi:hypothetical protein
MTLKLLFHELFVAALLRAELLSPPTAVSTRGAAVHYCPSPTFGNSPLRATRDRAAREKGTIDSHTSHTAAPFLGINVAPRLTALEGS